MKKLKGQSLIKYAILIAAIICAAIYIGKRYGKPIIGSLSDQANEAREQRDNQRTGRPVDDINKAKEAVDKYNK